MDKKCIKLPFIPLKDTVILNGGIFKIDIGKNIVSNYISLENIENKPIFFILQKKINISNIKKNDIEKIGVVGIIKKIDFVSNNIVQLTIEGINRAEILNYYQDEKKVEILILEDISILPEQNNAFVEILIESFSKFISIKGNFGPDKILNIISEQNLIYLMAKIFDNINLPLKNKQIILNENNILNRANILFEQIEIATESLIIQKEIINKTSLKISKMQRESFLKQHIKSIEEELKENSSELSETENYKKILKNLKVDRFIKEKIDKEIKRLDKIPISSAEYSITNDYIDFVLSLPWTKKCKINNNISKIEKTLDKSHFGLEKVKERILEHIVVMQNTNNNFPTIICLAGPPGVGKTSIAKSIANCLNIPFYRISLGGLRDEAEIRGHRKTYIGAMPGKIIKAIKNCKVNNPLILLDEIDKLSSDFKGDPASALLEVLDKEQHTEFKDNYIDLPFDISNVMFICTANDTSKIPPVLRDRLEIINISSYTKEEKQNIASKFLIPKQLEKHCINKNQLKINKSIIEKIVSEYTKETGVRQLERLIAQICRKSLKKLITNNEPITITKNNLIDFLGYPKFKNKLINKTNSIGVATGLAWSSFGGVALSIEAISTTGCGKLILTGNIGKIMNESCQAAISCIKSNSKKYNINENFFKKNDIHIHIPEGAIPKDGPSAGITLATVIFSCATKKKINSNVAMTGEITLRGNVLPIGGLKEKILAAKRMGIKTIIVPKENTTELEEIPNYVKQNVNIITVSHISEVLKETIINL